MTIKHNAFLRRNQWMGFFGESEQDIDKKIIRVAMTYYPSS